MSRGKFPFSIKQRAERSLQNALLSGKTEPPEKFLPESPSILLFCGLEGVSEERQPAAFYEKAGYRFPEKVAVASERQSGSFLEQDSTAVPKFAFRSFCPCGNLVGECLPQTLLMRLAPLKNPSK